MAGARGRKGVVNRKRTVQQFNEVIELLGSTGLKVLKLLGAGNTASQTAKVIPCVKSNITYWKNKLVRLGLVRLQTHDVFKIYRLTIYGSKVLTRSEKIGVPVETVVLEDHAVKFHVVEDERVGLDWCKLGKPRNWVKLGVRVAGVRVVKTSRSVIVHPGRLKGWDTKELLFDSGRVVERVKNVLESRFGMVLSDVGVPLHKPVFQFFSDEAKEILKHGTIIVRDRKGERLGAVDESPPEREPHEEYDGLELGAARALFPVTLIRLEKKVDALTRNVLCLVDTMEKFTETFKKLVEQPGRVNNLSEKRVDYVS